MEGEPSFDIDFEVPTPPIPERPYRAEAERLIAETFADEQKLEIAEHAQQSEAAERGILTALNEKLGRLGRAGLLAGALSGLFNMEEVQAPAPPVQPADTFSVMTGRPLSPAEGVAQALIRKQVGNRPLWRLELKPTLGPARLDVVEPKAIAISGFEKQPKAREAIEATLASLPDSFLDNLGMLRYEDRPIGMGSEYGLEGSQEVAHVNISTREMVFAQGSETYGPFMISTTLAHEACHLNGPDTHRGLEPTDRYTLYQMLLVRVQAPDRHRFSYVESINNPDPHTQLYRKASEYWAEACEAYLSGVVDLPVADKAMVQALIEKTDPAFDEKAWERARMARGAILLKLSPPKPKPKA